MKPIKTWRRDELMKNSFRIKGQPIITPMGRRIVSPKSSDEDKAQIEAAIKAIKKKYYSSNVRIERIENKTAFGIIIAKVKSIINKDKIDTSTRIGFNSNGNQI